MIQIAADIDEIIANKITLAKSQKSTVQPYMLVVGSYKDATAVHVIVNDIKYSAINAIAGLDLMFKIYWTAHLEYPQDCVILWLFFQRAVYQVRSPFDKSGTQLGNLFSAFKRITGIKAV